MLLLIGAFIAGMITVLAPCVLPLLPIIIGGSVSGNTKAKQRPYIIAISLAISLIVFTLLLKATTLLINIPPQAITYVSGTIIIAIGVLSLFPLVYDRAISKIGLQSRSQRLLGKGTQQQNNTGAIITGAALGPVFSSCSPVYAYILATILPANFGQAFAYIISYVLGLSIVLLLVGILGQRFVNRIRFASDPKGWFQRVIAILFIIVGLLVFTGYDKRVQTWVSNHTPFDFDRLSSQLIPAASNEPTKAGIFNIEPYPAPAFSDDLTEWINSKPLQLSELKGKVVLVDFWTYSCINCIRTQPYLRAWNDTYKDDGLVIVGMHAPEFAFEKIPANVERAVKEAKLTYPIALDNNFSTWNAYENRYWPGSYLIDAEGKVRRVHSGEGQYAETEQAIRELLKEKGTNVMGKAMVSDAAKVPVGKDQTPETYLGSRRAVNYGGSPALIRDQQQVFAYPTEFKTNQWAISGSWQPSTETITAQGSDAKLRFKIAAKDVYLVASSANSQKIGVTLNGKPISQTGNAGSDIKDSAFDVKEAKLYKLVHYPSFKAGDTLELSVPAGVSLNVFTFGS